MRSGEAWPPRAEEQEQKEEEEEDGEEPAAGEASGGGDPASEALCLMENAFRNVFLKLDALDRSCCGCCCCCCGGDVSGSDGITVGDCGDCD